MEFSPLTSSMVAASWSSRLSSALSASDDSSISMRLSSTSKAVLLRVENVRVLRRRCTRTGEGEQAFISVKPFSGSLSAAASSSSSMQDFCAEPGFGLEAHAVGKPLLPPAPQTEEAAEADDEEEPTELLAKTSMPPCTDDPAEDDAVEPTVEGAQAAAGRLPRHTPLPRQRRGES